MAIAVSERCARSAQRPPGVVTYREDVPPPCSAACPGPASNANVPQEAGYHCGIVVRMAFTLRTDEELEQALDALVQDEGLSRQEIIRRAVLDRYQRAGHERRVADSTERMIERWGDVLERLGSV